MMHNQTKTHPKGFEVKTTTKAGGSCKQWKDAKFVDLYNNSDPWCNINGDWTQSHVARFYNGGSQHCCTDWRD